MAIYIYIYIYTSIKRALCARTGPLWGPWATVGPPGLLWLGPCGPPLGLCGPVPCGLPGPLWAPFGRLWAPRGPL